MDLIFIVKDAYIVPTHVIVLSSLKSSLYDSHAFWVVLVQHAYGIEKAFEFALE